MKKEELSSLYKKAYEYSKVRYNKYPDQIILEDDGSIQLRFEDYWCGSYEYNSEFIEIKELSKNLEEIYNERVLKEAEEQRIREEEYKKSQELRKVREKEERKAQYLKLKKEFE